jgi:hypothetical protein
MLGAWVCGGCPQRRTSAIPARTRASITAVVGFAAWQAGAAAMTGVSRNACYCWVQSNPK